MIHPQHHQEASTTLTTTSTSPSIQQPSATTTSLESNDPNAVVGLNGFTIRKPFPYKNAQGDIFCIVCCLQKGELVFQPKANFKIFRERGAVIAENSDRSILVEKLFGFKNVCGGRLCDSHYRYIMKFKNKYIPSSGDSPTNTSANNDGGDTPTNSSKRKKRKSDKKESEETSLVISTKKKKKQVSTPHQHHLETRSSSTTPSSDLPSSSNLSLDFDHQERERDFDSTCSMTKTIPSSSSHPSSSNHEDSDDDDDDTSSNHECEYSTKELKREQRYGAKRRFNFLVRLVEELVQEENIHEQYRILVEQRKQQNKVKKMMTHNMKQFEEENHFDENSHQHEEHESHKQMSSYGSHRTNDSLARAFVTEYHR
ncbi:hypothetical protein C9374_005066 [Naegleria lovaniensis]|uniref:Uncharacterized protein n=1 Tax=Naegleria lovaniensis TaxID=51637 RepID=A0AA88GK78_NAELO|nr:uncharacterized protein C9374_005066 [Naegleria lovaniensis]KAG2382486.1 hypothetical protein C9374_005066 [Naegleria lovaniensis]